MNMNRLNILFITQEDPFYIKTFFEEFLSSYSMPHEIKALVIARTMGDKTLSAFIRRMINFYGPYDFFRMGIRYASLKCMNVLAVALKLKRFYSIEALFRHHRIQVIRQNNINDQTFLKSLEAFDLDLIISVAAPLIFKKEIISLPRFGCINIHHGMLPRYRGMMPNFWQMYNGEKRSGITIHKINPRLDDGDIILQREVTIQKNESLDSLIRRTKKIGAHCMIEAINLIKKGHLEYKSNDGAQASYHSFPTRGDVKKFKAMGYRII